jgi:hypothetical protein
LGCTNRLRQGLCLTVSNRHDGHLQGGLASSPVLPAQNINELSANDHDPVNFEVALSAMRHTLESIASTDHQVYTAKRAHNFDTESLIGKDWRLYWSNYRGKREHGDGSTLLDQLYILEGPLLDDCGLVERTGQCKDNPSEHLSSKSIGSHPGSLPCILLNTVKKPTALYQTTRSARSPGSSDSTQATSLSATSTQDQAIPRTPFS